VEECDGLFGLGFDGLNLFLDAPRRGERQGLIAPRRTRRARRRVLPDGAGTRNRYEFLWNWWGGRLARRSCVNGAPRGRAARATSLGYLWPPWLERFGVGFSYRSGRGGARRVWHGMPLRRDMAGLCCLYEPVWVLARMEVCLDMTDI